MKMYLTETNLRGIKQRRELNPKPIEETSPSVAFSFFVLKNYGERVYKNYYDALEMLPPQEALDLALDIEQEMQDNFTKNWG